MLKASHTSRLKPNTLIRADNTCRASSRSALRCLGTTLSTPTSTTSASSSSWQRCACTCMPLQLAAAYMSACMYTQTYITDGVRMLQKRKASAFQSCGPRICVLQRKKNCNAYICGVVSRLAAACSVVSVVWMCTCVYVCVCENAVAWVTARHISGCERVVGSGLVCV
jgi:hypothetical protein